MIITQTHIIFPDGTLCKGVEFKTVHLDIAFEWLARTKHNEIECSEGETITIPKLEWLNSDLFVNDLSKQYELLEFTLNKICKH